MKFIIYIILILVSVNIVAQDSINQGSLREYEDEKMRNYNRKSSPASTHIEISTANKLVDSKGITLKPLTEQKHRELLKAISAECEWYFYAPIKYSNIEDITKPKLNQILKWAKKYECTTVYMDYNRINSHQAFATHSSTRKKYDFYVICTKEETKTK